MVKIQKNSLPSYKIVFLPGNLTTSCSNCVILVMILTSWWIDALVSTAVITGPILAYNDVED